MNLRGVVLQLSHCRLGSQDWDQLRCPARIPLELHTQRDIHRLFLLDRVDHLLTPFGRDERQEREDRQESEAAKPLTLKQVAVS
jgi:hypothetical protein